MLDPQKLLLPISEADSEMFQSSVKAHTENKVASTSFMASFKSFFSPKKSKKNSVAHENPEIVV